MDRERQRLNRLLGEYAHAKRSVREERLALKAAERAVARTEEAQRFLQAAAASVQQSAHRQIAGVVTRCLRAVFGEDAYEFVIQFEQKRGKTEAKLLFRRGDVEVDPTTAAGGGVVDVASFALRLACLVLARPRKRRFLVLDEPWKHLSADYRPAVRELIESLARELGVQFILVTHSEEFEIGKVVRL